MGLFSRDSGSSELASKSPSASASASASASKSPSKAKRPVTPKVRLRPDELKATNQLTSKERLIGYALAVYGLGVFIWRTVPGGLVGREGLYLGLGVVLTAALAGLARFTNRIGLSLGAVGCAVWPYGPKWQLFAYPFLGLMLYITLAMSRSRQKAMATRASLGDFADPMAERQAQKKKPVTAKEDTTGRAYASKSKRYTPPKAPAKPSIKPPAATTATVTEPTTPAKESRASKAARSLGIKEDPVPAKTGPQPFK
jgi:hypothetical protein